MMQLEEFSRAGHESGVGLALRDHQDRYLFFLAGRRFSLPPGMLFYAGVGGHREEGESLTECARREAWEEIGAEIELEPAPQTWYLPADAPTRLVEMRSALPPLALYEMCNPPGSAREGSVYRIVIFQARMLTEALRLEPDEVRGLIALTPRQVVDGPARSPSLAQLLSGGARLIVGADEIPLSTTVYPIGTARALATILAQSDAP